MAGRRSGSPRRVCPDFSRERSIGAPAEIVTTDAEACPSAGAIGFALAIGLTCSLAAWALRGMGGALLPAIGWFVASFALAMPNPGGSVIIANTSAGEWYLYGGSICALFGVASAFAFITRRPPLRRDPGRP